jgi:hypothetical protein
MFETMALTIGIIGTMILKSTPKSKKCATSSTPFFRGLKLQHFLNHGLKPSIVANKIIKKKKNEKSGKTNNNKIEETHTRTQRFIDEQIDKSIAWAYFDGTCQGDPPLCGVGRVIHFNDHHVITYKVRLGRGTNNMTGLMASKLLLNLATKKGA